MPKKKAEAPLLVIATKTPEAIGKYALAMFEGANGKYIANASLDYRHDPYTGAEVESASGVPVTVNIDPDAMMGVTCPGCTAINSMPLEQAAKLDSIHCLTCGVQNDYDNKPVIARLAELAGTFDEEDEDEDDGEEDEIVIEEVVDDEDEEDDGEDEDFDLDDEDEDEEDASEVDEDDEEADFDEDEEDAELEDEDGEEAGDYADKDKKDKESDKKDDEEDKSEDDDKDDEDDSEETSEVACLDMVSPETDEFAFARLGASTVVAFVGDVAVAKVENVDDVDAKRMVSGGFHNAFNKAVAGSSVEAALKINGFTPIMVDVANHLLAERDRQTASIQDSIGDAVTEKVERVIHCIDTVSAGTMCGMYADSGASQLFASLVKTLKDHNIVNASVVAKGVLAKALPAYNKGLITEAIALAEKSDDVIDTVRDTIQRFDATALNLDEADVEGAESESITARLRTPAKASTRKKEVAAADDENKQAPKFKGMFAHSTN